MNKARELLRTTANTVTEIAATVGFENVGDFDLNHKILLVDDEKGIVTMG
ncbi:hypothetical protein ACFQ3W_10370 [Paenibacillus puldeungensis]|uniref:HTH araC/xylS-type domain-containing protein n=1 Tax=Paenibacillus puldeungensis TaxID=696536 RepID=A0ABW3RW32_9BACL